MEQPAFELDDEPAEPTFSVGELTGLTREAVRRAFPAQVWVRGEVQNLKRSANGHTYFTLVEKAGRGDRVQARLDCALFRDDRRAVDRALAEVPGAELGNDVEVRIRGRVEIFAAQGRLQLVMTAIDPVFTVGGIAANRERVLRALAAEGLLDHNARLALPTVPLRIGLITSDDSAAYHDFVHELETSPFALAGRARRRARAGCRRRPAHRVLLAGARAARRRRRGARTRRGIARRPRGLRHRDRGARDRGDAGAGARRRGHETDRSVADEVAHTACKTPTACAQILVHQVRGFVGTLDAAAHRVVARARSRTALAAQELDAATRRVRRDAPAVVARAGAQVERRHGRVQELGRRRTRDAAVMLRERERALVAITARHLERATLRLDAGEVAVRALDPRRVLERGYTITRTADGRVVRRAGDVGAGSELVTELAGGRVISRVEAAVEDTDE